MYRYPHEFSGGQRQRIGIARALILGPHLLICNEPVSALDVSVQAQIFNLLTKLQKEFDLTYLFVAHDLSVINHIGDRVMVMYLGKIAEITSAERIYTEPRHPYPEALPASITGPGSKRKRKVLTGEVPMLKMFVERIYRCCGRVDPMLMTLLLVTLPIIWSCRDTSERT